MCIRYDLLQMLDEDTKMKDISGKELKVMDLFELTYKSLFWDCCEFLQSKEAFPKGSDYGDFMKILLIIPSHWSENTQRFLQMSANKVNDLIYIYVVY